MVTRRNLLKIGGITAAGLLTQGSVRKHSRPNILFVFTDQQTWRAMSCAGIPLLPSFRGRSLKAASPCCRRFEAGVSKRSSTIPRLNGEITSSRNWPTINSIRRERRVWSGRRNTSTMSIRAARDEQLFDLKYDPGETQNLAYEPSMKPIVKRHRNLLRAWMRQTNDISCKAISELLSADMERTNDDNEHKIQA